MYTTVRLGYANAFPQKQKIPNIMDTYSLLQKFNPDNGGFDDVYLCGNRTYSIISVTKIETGANIDPYPFFTMEKTEDLDPVSGWNEWYFSLQTEEFDDRGSYTIVVEATMDLYPSKPAF